MEEVSRFGPADIFVLSSIQYPNIAHVTYNTSLNRVWF